MTYLVQIVVELAFASSVLMIPHARVSTNGEQLIFSVVQTVPSRVTHWASGILAWNIYAHVTTKERLG